MTGLVFVVLSVAVLAVMWRLAGRIYPTHTTRCRACEGTGTERVINTTEPFVSQEERWCSVCSGTGVTK